MSEGSRGLGSVRPAGRVPSARRSGRVGGSGRRGGGRGKGERKEGPPPPAPSRSEGAERGEPAGSRGGRVPGASPELPAGGDGHLWARPADLPGDRAGGSEGGWGTRPWSARSAGKGPFVLDVAGEGDIAANGEPTGKASPGARPWNAPAGAAGGRAGGGGNGSRSCAPQEGVLGMAGGEPLLMCEPEGVLSRGRRMKVQRGCAASRISCSAAEVVRKKDWSASDWKD